MYRCFKRTWWKENPSWPNGLEPHCGEKEYVEEEFLTRKGARDFCEEWNAENDPGRHSVKMEFERA